MEKSLPWAPMVDRILTSCKTLLALSGRVTQSR
jgi:hypothetical protein